MPRTDGRSAARRSSITLAATLALLGASLAGCADLEATDASDAHTYAPHGSASAAADPGRDPGCVAALKAISAYGPSSVKLLADGRKALNKVGVQLLVTALGSAADAADQPQVRRDIQTLADVYDDYFDLSTDAVSVPLSTLLKDTVDLEGLCHG
ncbi:hypothetical protein [Actinospica robiniae]|uniref:hypothetical protein n=1 Tax=Actinospica robiniae TaxID=304901 RepID=UPI00041B7246|nr:hypothetical protein [Actinospica robiniae]